MLAHSALDIIRTTSTDGALTSFLTLMTIGALFARLPQAPTIAVGAGLISTGAAVLALVKGDESVFLAIAYLGSALLLLSAALILRSKDA